MSVHYLTKRPFTHIPDDDDPQAHRVYRMEACMDGGTVEHQAPLAFLEKVAAKAARTWKVKKPKIILVDLPRAYWNGEHEHGVGVTLNSGRHGQNLLTLLHEMAHWIVDCRDYAVDSHGPEFMWIYIELMEQFNLMPRVCSLELCRIYNVKVG
jgi:hypothetical protein